MFGAQVDGAPVVGGAVERERAERQQPEQQQSSAGSHERRLAPAVVLGDQAGARCERDRQADGSHDGEVRADRELDGGRRGASEAAGDQSKRVPGVQAREQCSLRAALELGALGVHGDVDDAVGQCHRRQRSRQCRQGGSDADGDQPGCEGGEPDPQRAAAAEPRDGCSTSRQADDRAGFKPEDAERERARRQVQLGPDGGEPGGPRRRQPPGHEEGDECGSALDVGKLATLRAVVAHGSFSAAGQAIGLTQPAVSRQVSLLERRLGIQLVRRSQHGVHPTEAGRLLVEHTDAILARVKLAEAQIADLAGLRAGHVRLGSFLTALVYLSAELAALLEARHPALFSGSRHVIEDTLVDRAAALRGLVAAELDVAIFFEHAFEPDPAPPDIELIALFDDPLCVLLPAAHPLAGAASVTPAELRSETWIRAHQGSAARLTDHVLHQAGLRPAIRHAGHGDEPIEAQAFVAAGHGITLTHRLNILLNPDQMTAVPLAGDAPVRHVQAAIMRNQRAPAARAVIDALRDIGHQRTARSIRCS